MNKYLKKIKHLRITFLEYADERSIVGHWSEDLKEDFDFIENMEFHLGVRSKISSYDMKICNRLYRKYSNV